MNRWNIVVFLLLGLLVSCQLPQQEETAPNIEHIRRPKVENRIDNLFFDYDFLANEIENYFLDFDEEKILHQHGLVQSFYASQGYEPHWLDISDTSQHKEFLEILASAERHGLKKNTYHFDRLATNLENLSFFYFETGGINYQLWAESEILLSDAFILLTEHLKRGVFNALNDADYHYFIPPKDTVFEPFEVFYVDNLPHFFENLIFTPRYLALQNELVKRLEKPEKSRTKKDTDTLNILRVNLERWRWNSLLPDTGKVVYVNIPAFEMIVFTGNSARMTSKVCVGTKRPKTHAMLYQEHLKNPKTTVKPRHHETPILKDTIRYMVLNPDWRVPSSIARNTVLKNIQKDSNYLSKMGYLVYQGNVLIDPNSVDWQSMTSDNFPYHLEQSAGEQNAMGRMKFMFPNQHAVYLHDTPSKRDFSRQNRAVSHGCVRVENYMELALVLLSDMPKYDLAYLRKSIGLDGTTPKHKTENVFFKTPIPIIIDYKTAWIDADGNLQIFSDVYERDA
ncbi:MAG: L,D-transpeptidase family protein, partial [Bacteroidales bacterium]|nr:L,D-transpeptidase family protein [Bacteroidales bacterium]